ncbi:hypothetical protein AB1E33_08725 [Ruegeria sp. 2012CJ15-1]
MTLHLPSKERVFLVAQTYGQIVQTYAQMSHEFMGERTQFF